MGNPISKMYTKKELKSLDYLYKDETFPKELEQEQGCIRFNYFDGDAGRGGHIRPVMGKIEYITYDRVKLKGDKIYLKDQIVKNSFQIVKNSF
jgi:hypothetical protein